MYQIKDWDRHFENAVTHRVQKMEWVKIPTRHDGKGYRRLMAHPHGAEIFGAWIVLVQVASKMPKRGILADEDGQLDANDISDASGFPVSSVTLALQVLSDTRIGWIINTSQTSTNVHEHLKTFRNVHEQPREEKKREEERRESEKTQTAKTLSQEMNMDKPSPGPCPSTPEDAWHLVRLEPWAVRLAAIVGNGPMKTDWPAYKRLVDKFGIESVAKVADGAQPAERWANRLEPQLIEISTAAPAFVSSHDLALNALRVQAEKIIALRGWKACLDYTGLSGVSSEQETLTECKENPGFAAELVEWHKGSK